MYENTLNNRWWRANKINKIRELWSKIYNDYPSYLIPLYIKIGRGEQLLFDAKEQYKNDIKEPLYSLIEHNINPNFMQIKSHWENSDELYHQTCLHVACQKNDTEFIKLLLKKGADPDDQNQIYDVMGERGFYPHDHVYRPSAYVHPLCIVYENKNFEIVKLLITHPREKTYMD